jgi:hypothetical protein
VCQMRPGRSPSWRCPGSGRRCLTLPRLPRPPGADVHPWTAGRKKGERASRRYIPTHA